MKTICIFFLFAIVATTLEKIAAEYLLVEIDDEEGKGIDGGKGIFNDFVTHQVILFSKSYCFHFDDDFCLKFL